MFRRESRTDDVGVRRDDQFDPETEYYPNELPRRKISKGD